MIEYYPFELHTHTLHSDGNFTPRELAQKVKAGGYAGFALTDHNTVSGRSDAVREGEKLGLVVLPGIEWTTFYGHLTVIGGDFREDWRKVNPSNVFETAKRVKASGALIGIAHPFRIGYPICTGGSDEWGLTDYSPFTHYEVWSYLDPALDPTNAEAEKKYLEICESGARLACVYGRDWHSSRGTGIHAATYLGIEGELSANSAIEAIKDLRTYISTGVTLEASLTGEKTYEIGSRAPEGDYLLKVKFTTSEGYDKPNKLILEGSASGFREYALDERGEAVIKLNLKKGVMQIKAEGKEGKNLIATPYFIK
jgi:Predicted metal-dependent phosphoesterases (PHP family)